MARPGASHGPVAWLTPQGIRRAVGEADRVDRALYAAVAQTPTPRLDGMMRRLTRAADHSRLSIAAAAVLALSGGDRGRRAAQFGLTSVAATSALANLVIKPLGRRRRPERHALRVAVARRVRMPRSHSFPSGHTATAVAFASGAGRVLPVASTPLHCLAALVGYSRVHTGVHYPGDVVTGALLGAIVADLTVPAVSALRSLVGVDGVAEGRGEARSA